MPLSGTDAYSVQMIEAASDSTRLCKLTGYIDPDGGGTVRLYPTEDAGLWLDIDERDIIETIEADEPSAPSTIFVAAKSRMTLRMSVSAEAAQSLTTMNPSPGAAARGRTGWRVAGKRRRGNRATVPAKCNPNNALM